MRRAVSNEDLMRYLDGELPDAKRAEVEAALSRSTELSREFAIYRALASDMRDLTFAVYRDTSIWGAVDRRLTRPVGWLLFVGGLVLWFAYGAWVFTTSDANPIQKIAIAGVVVGFLVLLTSTMFERLREWRTDPYRDIER